MTKKMFQISRILMVVLTIGVCLTLLLDGRVMILDKHIYLNSFLMKSKRFTGKFFRVSRKIKKKFICIAATRILQMKYFRMC